LGDLCARANLPTEARAWYERALTINPQFSQAREALARLEH
jgi:Tfp pilus assembly protein PilF